MILQGVIGSFWLVFFLPTDGLSPDPGGGGSIVEESPGGDESTREGHDAPFHGPVFGSLPDILVACCANHCEDINIPLRTKNPSPPQKKIYRRP